MKKIKYLALVAFIAFAVSSCTDTNYEEFESDIELIKATDDEEGEDSKPGTAG